MFKNTFSAVSSKIKSASTSVKTTVLGGGLLATSSGAFAAVQSEVTTALTDGKETMIAVASGLVLMAAAMLGVGLIIKALNR